MIKVVIKLLLRYSILHRGVILSLMIFFVFLCAGIPLTPRSLTQLDALTNGIAGG
jgi:hypothetical protein